MPVIPTPGALLLRDCLVTIGTDSYQKQVSQVELAPTVTTQTWQGMTPDATVSESTPSTWAVTISFAQDWEQPGSLCNYLLENEGDLVTMVFEPRAGGATFTVPNVSLTPGTIGGTVGSMAVASVTMGCGKPVKSA